MISVNRKDYLLVPLIILFALEVCAVTDYKQPQFSQLTATLIFLFSGALIAVLPFIIHVREKKRRFLQEKKIQTIARAAFGIFFLAVVVFVIHQTQITLSAIPIDYRNADMIPQIKICCERLIAGEKVYTPMLEIWNGKLTTYLPAMWLPYLPLEYFGCDVRWTGVCVLLFFFGFYIFLIPASKNAFVYLIPLLAICGFIFWFLFKQEPTYIAWTEESVVIGFHLFLGFALNKKNPRLIGVAIALCLLSRYTLLFWIPVFILFSFFFESKKNALKIFIAISILVLFLFLLPFGIWNMNYFLNTQAFYLEQALFFRKHNSDIYSMNIGFAGLFSLAQFPLLHKLIIAVAFTIPIVCLAIFFAFRKRLNSSREYFGLCSLKLTMVAFYSLIEMPFYYLFFVPVFFSLPIIFLAIKGTDVSIQAAGPISLKLN